MNTSKASTNNQRYMQGTEAYKKHCEETFV